MIQAGALRGVRTAGSWLLDFALPPRCPGCGDITPAVDLFCGGCWSTLDFLGGGCDRCGLALAAGVQDLCLECEGSRGPLDRIRAGLAYGEIPRSIAMRLKYGRKIALARTMASTMKRALAELDPEALLVPVPLHRWRLWGRGFNQSVLLARALGRTYDPDLLRRTRATPRLKGLNPAQRRKTVENAFAIRPGAEIRGRSFILVDDVMTTGATAEACARLLRRAGAGSVELLAFARVLK
ncbi:ComF family protein [Sphingomonas kaistensis]|uniref:ComF family protein n=1 Tax=Sphingomonas kaistensis TaxID=298708 RepID=A0A7X5Y8Y5_9SPHN|nr:ComF family protein [Sphingomonas kaistensis]NJC06085.1 ComF family protein [Sphingomonas kaistensis]